MVTSEPSDRWVWRMARRFDGKTRTFRALHTTSVRDAAAELASVVSITSQQWPERPARYWDDGALRRLVAREGESFVLTDRARAQILRNRYPDPERLLQHVELLADCAEAWHEEMRSGAYSSQRFEEWALREFSLTIALHDKGIKDRDAYCEYDGVRLDNRPHVKVDDAVALSGCGRIYFAIDDRRAQNIRRLVVDHIGLHDRS